MKITFRILTDWYERWFFGFGRKFPERICFCFNWFENWCLCHFAWIRFNHSEFKSLAFGLFYKIDFPNEKSIVIFTLLIDELIARPFGAQINDESGSFRASKHNFTISLDDYLSIEWRILSLPKMHSEKFSYERARV